jgi:hypothetical protein
MLTPADPAPCVVLRLVDSEQTRELWPHAFELLYKITLMEDEGLEEEEAARQGQDVQVSGLVAGAGASGGGGWWWWWWWWWGGV